MPHLLLLIGISGAGKSTFARQFVRDNPSYLRLNRDDLRRSLIPVSLGEYWTWDDKPKNRIERLVTALLDAALKAALDGGWNVVLDNTHLRQKSINEVLKLAEAQATAKRPVDVSFQVFDVPLTTAIERDRQRPDVVGETVIREQHSRLQLLRKNMDFSQRLTYPRPHPTADPLAQDAALPKCILVDIDGTVAKIHDRSPFDWTNVGRDKPNLPVMGVVRAMRAAGCAVVFMSGRDGAARAETVAWLERHFGWQETADYQLFMRKQNDMRKDAIVKRELFDAHIRGRYFVELVLDDRDQVVSLWRRDLGLTCLQVDYGDF
ncbi:phosphatase domain-containing protein [Fibrella aquatilis]|uniref:AAA family ATPase n=1 Tax=Fibrella aquatilis TaxID=2817059 RepID=A0A939G485_9BACT|nr:AAA family ATPase [Fibrella aquatilis]MBO0930135.1 AAA family ATPase [Fibrella aquatilis]